VDLVAAGARCLPSTVLDDYQYGALSLAGWSVPARGDRHRISDQLADSNTVAVLIKSFLEVWTRETRNAAK
jgi:hypothetical protein